MRGATITSKSNGRPKSISTHTPLARRDPYGLRIKRLYFNFYSHASCEARLLAFLISVPAKAHFYSHASCEARRKFRIKTSRSCTFLLTRLLRGATETDVSRIFAFLFLLTRPMRGATLLCLVWMCLTKISTHTPHAGRDVVSKKVANRASDFYSHAPCGARRKDIPRSRKPKHFYSHAPCGARQRVEVLRQQSQVFLLTRPMRGATLSQIHSTCRTAHFYSHAPCGARQTSNIFTLLSI